MQNEIMFVAYLNGDEIKFKHIVTPNFHGVVKTTMNQSPSYYHADGSITLAKNISETHLAPLYLRKIKEYGELHVGKTGLVGLYLSFFSNKEEVVYSTFMQESEFSALHNVERDKMIETAGNRFSPIFLYYRFLVRTFSQETKLALNQYLREDYESSSSIENQTKILCILAKEPIIYIRGASNSASSILHRVHEMIGFMLACLNGSIYLMSKELNSIFDKTNVKISPKDVNLPHNGSMICFEKSVASFMAYNMTFSINNIIISKCSDKILFYLICKCPIGSEVFYFNMTLSDDDYIISDIKESNISYPRELFKFEDIYKIINITYCSVLYITNHPDYVKSVNEESDILAKIKNMQNQKKISKLKKLADNLIDYTYVYPSRSVKNYNESVANREKGKLSHLLQTVAGHFKYQPYGKERRSRKYIWIKPYIRGIDNQDDSVYIDTIKVKKIRQ